MICSYIGTFVIAFVIGCAVVDDERIVVVMAYTTVIVNALLAAMAYLLNRSLQQQRGYSYRVEDRQI